MIRDVNLVRYLPPYMQEYKEPVETLKAENPEFTLEWKAADKVFRNRFISTADEDGIAHYEKILGIRPNINDSLESRRIRIQNNWFNKVPYVYRVFLARLALICGNRDFTIERDFKTGYYIRLSVSLIEPGLIGDLDNLIKTMFPENMVIDVNNRLYFTSVGYAYVAGNVGVTRHYSIMTYDDTWKGKSE